ncbi:MULTISPECIES: helix-turn-helix domain-containing protein [unclassified Streptomyces]|uniref:helix-turn-helix domain-containing protein n=1 Tax=unclassified Streptomyces TaxID=2593676 RepID=UPI0035DD7520
MSERADQRRGPANGTQYFAAEVRALRAHLKLSQTQFADALHYDQGMISRVENGKALASPAFAEALDELANTPGVYTRMRAQLTKTGNPAWFVPYLTLEEDATDITDYSCTFLMGLVQTPSYAEAVFRAAFPRESPEEIAYRVDVRMRRQEVLRKDKPPLLWVVIHESVLWAQVGGAEVMRAQLEHLIELAQSPHVTLQILPYSAGAAPTNLPFTLLGLEDKPHAVYTETPTHGGQVDDDPKVVAGAVAMLDRLRMAALSEERSVERVRKIMKEQQQ